MSRIPFSQVLKNASVDIRKEYDRLYTLFYLVKHKGLNLRTWCAIFFTQLPLHGRCISLDDFDSSNNIHFEKAPKDFDINYLIDFCEYSYNIANYEKSKFLGCSTKSYLEQVEKVIEAVGYMAIQKDGVTDFVTKNQAAISVAEIVEPNLSYKVIEYNHHSMMGKLDKKRDFLRAFAHELEPKQSSLEKINKDLKNDLFFLFNNMDIRHNNSDSNNGKKYKEFVDNMNNKELEDWYDYIYKMCLLAFLELEHLERKEQLEKLKEKSK